MTQHDEAPEDPRVAAAQSDAAAFVTNVATYAASQGWEFVLVSVSRRLDLSTGQTVAPGSTAIEFNQRRMGPALPVHADGLRKLASDLDEAAAGAQDCAAVRYVQDKSDYASGRREWPK